MYSSDRISQLMGNGILSFLSDENGMRKLFSDDEAVFFKNHEDLEKKIMYFHNNDDHRKAISAAGRKLYHEQFSAMNIINFIIETTFNMPYSFEYSWSSEVYS
jgi:spore maturation protein CgeB